MHELGIVIQVVKQMEDYMTEHDIKQIDKLVLQIGALSSVYPKYIEDVYPIAVENSKLYNTQLEIDVTPGIGSCDGCGLAYDLVQNRNTCPKCGGRQFTVIRGKEFLIKEVHVHDEE